jgi:hypothetical protein
MLNDFFTWVGEKAPWVLFIVLAITGGAVAHIRTFEQAKLDLTFREHFWALARRSVVSGFAGMLVFLAADGAGMRGSPWSFFLAGLCGLFSAEAFDLAWRLVTAWLQGRVRITTPPPARVDDDEAQAKP